MWGEYQCTLQTAREGCGVATGPVAPFSAGLFNGLGHPNSRGTTCILFSQSSYKTRQLGHSGDSFLFPLATSSLTSLTFWFSTWLLIPSSGSFHFVAMFFGFPWLWPAFTSTALPMYDLDAFHHLPIFAEPIGVSSTAQVHLPLCLSYLCP